MNERPREAIFRKCIWCKSNSEGFCISNLCKFSKADSPMGGVLEKRKEESK